jgi:hypothetical protein
VHRRAEHQRRREAVSHAPATCIALKAHHVIKVAW